MGKGPKRRPCRSITAFLFSQVIWATGQAGKKKKWRSVVLYCLRFSTLWLVYPSSSRGTCSYIGTHPDRYLPTYLPTYLQRNENIQNRWVLSTFQKSSLLKKKKEKNHFVYLLSCLLHAGLLPGFFLFVYLFIFQFFILKNWWKSPSPQIAKLVEFTLVKQIWKNSKI